MPFMYYKIGERIEEFEPTTFDNIDFQYIAVIGLSALIFVGCLIFFKKKKWL